MNKYPSVRDLKKYIANLPDDYEIWIEYPKEYGLAQPEKIVTYNDGGGEIKQNFIESLTLGRDNKNKRLLIFHHY